MAETQSANQKCSKNPTKYYITEEERRFYSENGYLIIRELFDENTLDSFRQQFSAICNNKELAKKFSVIPEKSLAKTNSNPADYINKVQDILHDKVFMRFSEDPRLLHIASQFLGEELTGLNCMLVNKPPNSTRHPSHQDAYYFPIRPMSVVAAWTAIDATDKQNGCLYCVPRSHKRGLLPHGLFQDSKKFFHVISDEGQVAPEHRRVYLPMTPGDTVVFHPHLIHGSGANYTKGHRKAMTIHYMSSSCEFVDLCGSEQSALLEDFRNVVQSTGKYPQTYRAMWEMRSKKVKRVQSQL